jgi:Fe2+ or Zn2+ uptake regulation protein
LETVWAPHTLQYEIVTMLQKKGAIADTDLHKELKESYGDVSFREVNRALMKLELIGIIRVSRLLKKKRRVELVEKSH